MTAPPCYSNPDYRTPFSFARSLFSSLKKKKKKKKKKKRKKNPILFPTCWKIHEYSISKYPDFLSTDFVCYISTKRKYRLPLHETKTQSQFQSHKAFKGKSLKPYRLSQKLCCRSLPLPSSFPSSSSPRLSKTFPSSSSSSSSSSIHQTVHHSIFSFHCPAARCTESLPSALLFLFSSTVGSGPFVQR